MSNSTLLNTVACHLNLFRDTNKSTSCKKRFSTSSRIPFPSSFKSLIAVSILVCKSFCRCRGIMSPLCVRLLGILPSGTDAVAYPFGICFLEFGMSLSLQSALMCLDDTPFCEGLKKCAKLFSRQNYKIRLV